MHNYIFPQESLCSLRDNKHGSQSGKQSVTLHPQSGETEQEVGPGCKTSRLTTTSPSHPHPPTPQPPHPPGDPLPPRKILLLKGLQRFQMEENPTSWEPSI